VNPSFLPGDAVTVVPVHLTGTLRVPALVISVRESDQVPDAWERGLGCTQPYNYWVMTYGNHAWGIKFMGPYKAYELKSQWDGANA